MIPVKILSHADDFGLDPTITAGIISGLATGHLTGVSAVVTHDHQPPRLPNHVQLGLHWNLTEGRPISAPDQIPHLVTAQGAFFNWSQLAIRLALGLIPPTELEREFAAQIEKFQTLYGRSPDQFDSHHHIHFDRRISPIAARLAGRKPLRWTADLIVTQPTPRGLLLQYVIQRAHQPSQVISLAGLLDPRWLVGPTLAANLPNRSEMQSYEVIWHLGTGSTFPWRTTQLTLLRNPNWWEGEGSIFRLAKHR